MANLYYTQGSTTLYKMTTAGVATALNLPSGVSLSSAERARFAILGRQVFLFNSPTVNLSIDPFDDTVTVLTPIAPPTAGKVQEGGSGDLTGTYRVKVAFGVRDVRGSVISLTNSGPESAGVALTSKNLKVTGIPTSSDASTNFRRIYRTLAGGRVYFWWSDLEGNTSTEFEASITDESIALAPEPKNLGNPPGSVPGGVRMKMGVPWKGKLWGVATGVGADLDTLRWSEFRRPYAWSAINALPIPPVGSDGAGITGIIPRRNVLGVAKRDVLHIITSSDPLTGERRSISEVGMSSPDAIALFDDTAWFLGEAGFYQWDNSGVENIASSDVEPWFTRDDTFNRAEFKNAISGYHHGRESIITLLSAAGSSDLDRWVEYYPKSGVWLGPHKTGEFTPTALAGLEDSNDLAQITFGSSNGFLWKEQATRTDGATTAVDFDVLEQWHSAGTPDIEKYWGLLSMLTEVEGSGTLTVTPTVGDLDASAGSGISHDLTTGRERLTRLLQGRFLRLRFRLNTAGKDATILGYEIDPVIELGRR